MLRGTTTSESARTEEISERCLYRSQAILCIQLFRIGTLGDAAPHQDVSCVFSLNRLAGAFQRFTQSFTFDAMESVSTATW